MKRYSLAIYLLSALLLLTPMASASASKPNTLCSQQSSNSATSTDGTAYVTSSAYLNTCTNNNAAQSSYEAYSGGTYTLPAFSNLPLCGGSVALSTTHNLAYGFADSSVCKYFATTANYNFNQLYTYNYPAEKGAIGVNTTAWSGNCANWYTGSSCVASVGASAPP